MKCVILYTISIAVCSATEFYGDNETLPSVDTRGVIENTINTTLNKIKENLSDPIVISSAPFDFGSNSDLSGGCNITKLIINGVKDFVASEIKAQLLKQELTMKITVPEITAQFKYWSDMVLLNLVPLYGQGRMSISLDDVEFAVKAGLSLTGGPKVKDVWLSITLNEAVFHLDGLLNNSEYSALLSNVLNDNFAEFVNGNAYFISSTISPIAQAIVNHFLEPEETLIVRGVNVFVKIN